ncbi:hypothetical protein ACJIZ3_017182 [Penstemon smallii]|uniref:GTD-binding domain-containing protein n=1 Tax=Penstemon smallii TaxID=265156 RepID=A0ABD3SUT8_9LAMI
MACQPIYMWTLSGLVSAFLDLAIAYLLLCASAVAFFASKILGFFGLNLPCPCNGLFFNIPNNDYCLNRLLVDVPTQKVSYVQFSVKHSFPFNDSVYGRSQNYSIGENNYVNGVLEIEGEASCSSVSDTRVSRNVVGREELILGDEKYDVKGKRVINHRARSRLRQRRKGVGGRGNYSSVSSYDPSLHEDFDPHHLEYDMRTPTVMEMSPISLTKGHTNDYPDEDMHMNKNVISIKELQENPQEVDNYDDNLSDDEKNAATLLEKALEEEQIARAALYIELEKERSAAASAADEAMAMILRLQEEKASIAMEARQYQRIIEEKSAYDAEEMKILKEILVRRETEKHFLEKELEDYRQMVSLGNEELTDDDPILMLHQLTDKNVMIEDRFSETSFGNESSIQFQGEKISFPNSDEQSMEMSTSNSVGNMDLQEKEMISADNLYLTPNGPQECKFLEEKIIIPCNGNETGDSNYDSKQKLMDEDTEDTHVYDVHVIGDGIKLRSKSEQQLSGSSSEMSSGIPPIGPKGKSSLTDLRKSSMSEVDSEMLKIDSEVGRLRERLKIVQEGRGKLSSLSVESREREDIQLKLLEDIARQVQEIRNLNEPGKAPRQVSLPLPTSKALSKKRRSRSVSSGLQRS